MWHGGMHPFAEEMHVNPQVAYARANGRRSKQKGRRADALALTADEGRDKLRKASGRSTYPSIRRFPNGATRMDRLHASIRESIAYGR